MSRFVAIIYFDGHASRWRRSSKNWQYEQHPGGVRIPLPMRNGSLMPEPDPTEVLQRREFRWQLWARIWGHARVGGLANVYAEIRPA